MNSQNRLETAGLLFAVLTCILIFAYPNMFNITFQIDATDQYPLNLDDDFYNDGNSFAEWIAIEPNLKWSCDLAEGFAYPYCSLKIDLTEIKTGEGIDLSLFDSAAIHYNYQGEIDDTIRIYVRTHHPDVTDFNNPLTYKYNEIEFKPSRDGAPYAFLMSDLKTASWWTLEQGLPAQMTRPNFSQVMMVEVSTGSNVSLGEKIFDVEKIVFYGKTVSKDNFYLAIIVIWLTFLFFVFALRMYQLNLAFQQSLTEKAVLKDLANRDQLTQLLNRRAIDKLFTSFDYSWKHQHEVYSLIVVDIDHFKRINDQKGHSVGDDVIKQLGGLLKNNSRNHDFVGRWGGEEFILLLHNTDILQATLHAEKLRKLIFDAHWPAELKITASFGVSTVSEELTADEVFTYADAALYRAKAAGRNQVIRSDNLELNPPEL